MLAKGGAPLLDDAAITVLKKKLLPLATLVTPNLPEAEALTGILPKASTGCAMPPWCSRCWAARRCCSRAAMARAIVRDTLWADGDFVDFRSAAPGHAPHPWHGLHPGHRHRLRVGAGAKGLRDAVSPRPCLCAGRDPPRPDWRRGSD